MHRGRRRAPFRARRGAVIPHLRVERIRRQHQRDRPGERDSDRADRDLGPPRRRAAARHGGRAGREHDLRLGERLPAPDRDARRTHRRDRRRFERGLRNYRAGGNPERVAISPDGTQIWAALEATAQAVGIDVESGERLGIFPTGVETEGVAVSPDGRFVYVTAETSHTVTVIDTESMAVVTHLLVGNRPRDVVFSHDGTRAYASAEIGGTISVIDVAEHRVIATVSLGLDSRPVELDLSPDGALLYVAGGGTSAVYVVDTATNEVAHVIRERMGRRPWGIAVNPDGSRVYTANGLSDSVSVIDTATMSVVGEIAAGRGAHSVEVGVVDAATDPVARHSVRAGDRRTRARPGSMARAVACTKPVFGGGCPLHARDGHRAA
jgi:YVTN family beta-propeller protein